MRLICPNCSAQYEIDIALVPDEGRDVQCSNCGHTWFELPPVAEGFGEDTPKADIDTSPDGDAKSDDDAKTDDAPETDKEKSADGPSHAAMAIAAASEDDDNDDTFFDRPAPERTPIVTVPPAKRRPSDAADVDLLKEEAAREMSKRRAPPSEPIEMQTDLGLAEIKTRQSPSRALRARMAHLNEEEAPATARNRKLDVAEPSGPGSRAEVISDAGSHAPRRDLLPDIDEINSTLKSTKTRSKAGAYAIAQQQKRFRFGFLFMMVLAILMIVAYAQAPAIARAFPGSEAALLPYVDGANAVRDWIDGLIGTSS